MVWFIVSSSAPQRGQWLSHLIWRWFRLLVTANCLDINCQVKCDFGRNFYFPSKSLELRYAGFPFLQFLLLKKVSCHPVTLLDSVHPILRITPAISIPLVILAYGQRLNQWDVIVVDIVFYHLSIPSLRVSNHQITYRYHWMKHRCNRPSWSCWYCWDLKIFPSHNLIDKVYLLFNSHCYKWFCSHYTLPPIKGVVHLV